MKVIAPRGVAKTRSASTTSAQSDALSSADLLITGDVDFYILFGTNPTATTACLRVPANVLVPFTAINGGEKFAVILASGTGTVTYAEVI